jgi:precorrin-2 dehydrogenase/sirohydrochlorin ferrochelatase
MELADQECLVVGGGLVAQRKVESLLEAGAIVTVVSPEVTQELATLASDGVIRWFPREYQSGDVQGYSLIIAATDDEPVNRQVFAEARERRLPVNVVDRPELCSFIVPAVARQGSLTLAVFTGGRSPMMARRIREELQAQYGPEYAEMLDLLGALRPRLMRAIPDQHRRQEVYSQLVYSDALDLLRQGRRAEVEARAEDLISRAAASK